MSFCTLTLEKQDDGPLAHIVDPDDAVLSAPEALVNEVTAGDVLIRMGWSTINYKDGLATTGKGPVVCKWPMVADVDGVGIVLDSSHPDWRAGDAVVPSGWGVDETHWGCPAQQAQLSGDWLVVLLTGFSMRQAMAIGMVGYTTVLSVLVLECVGVKPGDDEVLVMGISGGVGSITIALLSELGYRVVASIGKTSEIGFLQALGAREVTDRVELSAPDRSLQKGR